MGIILQDSDSGFDRVSKHLDAMMDEVLGHNFTRLVSSGAWEPQWNIYEVPDKYMVCVDLAGVDADQIDLQVDRGTLKVAGYRDKPECPSTDMPSIHAMEIDWGRFERSLALPSDANRDQIAASYKNGYLWILIPKQSEKE